MGWRHAVKVTLKCFAETGTEWVRMKMKNEYDRGFNKYALLSNKYLRFNLRYRYELKGLHHTYRWLWTDIFQCSMFHIKRHAAACVGYSQTNWMFLFALNKINLALSAIDTSQVYKDISDFYMLDNVG